MPRPGLRISSRCSQTSWAAWRRCTNRSRRTPRSLHLCCGRIASVFPCTAQQRRQQDCPKWMKRRRHPRDRHPERVHRLSKELEKGAKARRRSRLQNPPAGPPLGRKQPPCHLYPKRGRWASRCPESRRHLGRLGNRRRRDHLAGRPQQGRRASPRRQGRPESRLRRGPWASPHRRGHRGSRPRLVLRGYQLLCRQRSQRRFSPLPPPHRANRRRPASPHLLLCLASQPLQRRLGNRRRQPHRGSQHHPN
mmetsp:Transcript_27664/g.62994  ORF Transcript_27664/g.62994 Transcript_27664/m.62994 type:complete len:250 (-) Transcript_27664:12-761(-)